ncbi:uncharacterized protein LOC111072689 [Drosophila obscura]|uniref:uncharacterized protein LOC111072689 n=1 Tax=Drosophila obscura TaxID=7282 RepID=UPI001BB15CAD|nr:uncharacterized protein LOC111072689 [Drosophila obscura]
MSKPHNYTKARPSRRLLPSSTGSETERSLEDLISVTKLRISGTDTDDCSHCAMDKTLGSPQQSVRAVEVEVPRHPPFVALVGNLPMETSERELRQLFAQHTIRSLSLLRRGKRQRGGGAHVELETRQDLLELLKKDQMMCRGRRLSIAVCQDLGGGEDRWSMHSDGRWSRRSASGDDGDDGAWSRHSGSDADESSSECSARVRLSQSLGEASSGSSVHISRSPSSTEELERRMHVRLQKLADFENAETERAQSSQADEGEPPAPVSWLDFWSEVQKSEDL